MIEWKDFLCKDSSKFSNQKIRYIPKEKEEILIEQTSFFPKETSNLIRLISLRDGYSKNNPPLCGYCGVIVDRVYQGKMIRYCHSRCYSKTEEFRNNLRKSNYQQANQRRQETMKATYGVPFNLQRDSVRQKLGKHCSSDEFKEQARQRGYNQYNHIERDVYSPEKIALMNQTMTAPEIAQQIGCSPSFVLQSLKKVGLCGQIHAHSSQETRVRNLLNQYSIEHVVNDRSLIAPKELDIYIPSHSLAIEVNGLYWHSELNGKDKHYHLQKTLDCEKKGIRLLQFWDFEVEDKWPIVESMILNKLNLNQTRIGARVCYVAGVDSYREKTFLEDNHIQGYVPSSVCLGLYRRGELVSLMSFKRPRFNKRFDWELLRFCNKTNITVSGGASRLFSYRPSGSIITYADRRYSCGQLYNRLEFTGLKPSKPSYHYTKDFITLESRIKYQKHKLPQLLEIFNPSLTEWDNMVINGFDRVWDCGTSVFFKN